MNGIPYTLYKPLPFYAFARCDLLKTGFDLQSPEPESVKLSFNAPHYNRITEFSPFEKQCTGVLEQPALDITQNFIPIAHKHYNTEPVNLPWSTIHEFSRTPEESGKPVVHSPLMQKSNFLSVFSNKAEIKTIDFCKDEKGSKIWRPFSPECDNAANEVSFEGKEETVYEVSPCRFLPTILPSSVTLGESSSSVFKAVKKKKYQCQFCDQWYLNSGQLAGHVRAHIGSKPFRCEYQGCSRAFARNEELTRHRRIHSGVKPHQCETCEKRFGRKDHLNKHKKTHMKASEKNVYLCEVPGCKHRYTRSDALTRHLATAHSIKHHRSNSGRNRQNLSISDTKNSKRVDNPKDQCDK